MTHSENEPTPPVGGSQSADAIWYYVRLGERIGPVTEESIKLLLDNGTVHLDSLVWTKTFGKDWKSIRDTSTTLAVWVRRHRRASFSQ